MKNEGILSYAAAYLSIAVAYYIVGITSLFFQWGGGSSILTDIAYFPLGYFLDLMGMGALFESLVVFSLVFILNGFIVAFVLVEGYKMSKRFGSR